MFDNGRDPTSGVPFLLKISYINMPSIIQCNSTGFVFLCANNGAKLRYSADDKRRDRSMSLFLHEFHPALANSVSGTSSLGLFALDLIQTKETEMSYTWIAFQSRFALVTFWCFIITALTHIRLWRDTINDLLNSVIPQDVSMSTTFYELTARRVRDHL